jgi:hypothetical protein
MGTAGSLTAIYWLIPHFNPQHVYTYWSKNSCVGNTSAVAGAATVSHGDPISCLWDSATNTAGTKIELVFLLLAFTAFVAARSPLALLAVPNLGLRFISTDTSFWGTAYHYNAVLMPVLSVAAIDAIDRARRATPFGEEESPGPRRLWARHVSTSMGRHGAVAMTAAVFAMIPQFAFNQFFTPSTFTFDARTSELRRAASFVPENVTAEGTMNVLAQLAAKDDTFWIGNGGNPPVQYVVLDTVVSGFSGTISDPVQFVESRHPGVTYKVVWSDNFGICVLEKAG